MKNRTTLALPANMNDVLSRSLLGFDTLLGMMDSTNISASYPPHNIIRTSDTTYTIQFALAGFSKDRINIEFDNNYVTVTGSEEYDNGTTTYIHKGISSRAFSKSISLMDHMVVVDAEFIDGLLTINVEKVIPESLRKKTIPIK